MDNQEDQVMTGICLNCGSEFNGQYCALCGQSSRVGPLTIRTMLDGALAGLIDFDKPLYRTLIGLTIRPGLVISEYVEGKRAGYANPVKYSLTISALVIVLARFRGSFVEAANRSMSADPTSHESMAMFLHHYNDVHNAMQSYSHVISLLMIPFLAAFLYLVFRKSGRSFAEQMAFGCFTAGHISLLIITIMAFDLHHISLDAATALINVGPPVYIAWAAIVFNKSRVISGVFRSFLAYGLYLGVHILLMIVVVFIKMSGS